MSAAPEAWLPDCGPVPPDPARAALDAALLTAHAMKDRDALIRLYAEAAEISDGTAAAFYLTHAFVFALEAGDPRAPVLRAKLVEIGADIP
ncbi:hypothetical protein KUV65_03920 [Maritalea mobilis]|uniref:hypothetical protein n=1 Tax=Maritalea mobilis TaxID=483324 RepID=UPI001C989DE0|nr:hypothetical protein [Maritalea mobilis]MBY6200498.1 hypothetical protein [Maritalea mobilis]